MATSSPSSDGAPSPPAPVTGHDRSPRPRDVPGYAEAVAAGLTPARPTEPPALLPGLTAHGALVRCGAALAATAARGRRHRRGPDRGRAGDTGRTGGGPRIHCAGHRCAGVVGAAVPAGAPRRARRWLRHDHVPPGDVLAGEPPWTPDRATSSAGCGTACGCSTGRAPSSPRPIPTSTRPGCTRRRTNPAPSSCGPERSGSASTASTS